MLDAGYSLESARRISGHSARVMAMIYAHATDATVRGAAESLDQFADEKCDPIFAHGSQSGQHMQHMQRPRALSEKIRTKGKSKKPVKARSARAR
jgi:hypothetical protein